MKYLYLFIFILSSTFLQAQANKYVVLFTDKANTPYSVNAPSEFLSEKAIQRRMRQNIAISESDFPVNPTYLAAIRAVGVQVLNPSKWLNAATFSTPDSLFSTAAIAALPFVDTVFKVVKTTSNKPSPKFNKGNSANKTNGNPYGDAYTQIAMLNGDKLHDLGFKGNGITIAVLDAGFFNLNNLAAFDSMRTKGHLKGTYDFVDNNSEVFDSGNHGTNVLSTMAANVPGTMIGTAPEADYWLLRSEDDRSEKIIEEYNWVSAAEFADSVGADIINSSLGYTEFDDTTQDHTYADLDGKTTICTKGANMASAKGILVVNSAGNEGDKPWKYIGAPADGADVLTIGAVDASRTKAAFSSFGPTSDGRIKPTVSAQGAGALVARVDGSYSPSNGTSFSSPIVAGMAACLWQTNPNSTNTELITHIIKSASMANNPDNSLGYGIPDFLKAYQIVSGLDTQRFKGDLMAYPNRLGNQNLRITYTAINTETITISVYNMLRQLLYQTRVLATAGVKNDYSIIDLPQLQQGMYFVNVQSAVGTSTVKIFKE